MRGEAYSRIYPLLPYAAFAYFVLSFALHPYSPFYTHHLADPDDYMRLNEVAAWLQGQGWYDVSAPRLSPGAHTVVHWSRLIDLPIALLALPLLSPLGLTNALIMAALLVPLVWFVLLLALIQALAQQMVDKQRASLACALVLFAPLLLFNYTPGRVDHHGAQALIAGWGLLSLCRILRGINPSFHAATAAVCFALGLWIGAEALPWIILFITVLGAAAAWQGAALARTAACFGACFAGLTTALLPLALPAADFSSRALSWFSPAYALFAALAGGILIAGWAASCRLMRRDLRLALYAVLAAAAAVVFFALIPGAAAGPFTDYDAFDATTALDNISEAQPLAHVFRIRHAAATQIIPVFISFLRLLALPLAALVTTVWQAVLTRRAVRQCWLAQGLFLSAALLLAVFWQMRVGVFMELFMLAPLARLLTLLWEKLSLRWQHRRLFWGEIAAFLLIGPLPVLLLPATQSATAFYPDLALFPAARAAVGCPLEPVSAFLNNRNVFGNQPLTILNTSDSGPELLFTTHDNVIAGNFDVPGNADAYAFFHATDDRAAQAAARRWHADLVLLCKKLPTLYLGHDYYALSHVALKPGADGLLHLENSDKNQPLIARLSQGRIPGWLKPVAIPDSSDYLLFRIKE